MPKLIPRWEIALQRENDALKLEIQKLQEENECLKMKNARLIGRIYGIGKSSHHDTPSRKSPTTEIFSSTPSYSRPTAASSNRAVKLTAAEVKKTVEEDDRSPWYEDGKLVRVGSKSRPRYALATRASRHGQAASPWDEVDDSKRQTLWQPWDRSRDPPSLQKTTCPYTCMGCNKLEAAWSDESTDSLAARTRLEDEGVKFQTSPAGCLSIPHRTQFRLLNTACRIAQDVIFHHTRTHFPKDQVWLFFEGPREVKLCMNELRDWVGRTIWDPNHNRSDIVDRAVMNIANLRNHVAHQNRKNSAGLDVLLTMAQKLAVLFMDEKRAMRLRALRDELRTHAEKTAEQIETIYFNQWGPELSTQIRWRKHHIRTFEDLIAAHDIGEDLWRYIPAPEAVKLAAWDWQHANRSGRGSSPEYIAALERAKAQLVEAGSYTLLPYEGLDTLWPDEEMAHEEGSDENEIST